MTRFRPVDHLATHDVTNQPPVFEDFNCYAADKPLQTAIQMFGERRHEDRLTAFGAAVGSAETADWSRQANTNPPQLVSFDRFGHRLDEVDFHPAYHALMDLGLSAGVAGSAWTEPKNGHVLHAALLYMMGQADGGVCCPMSMTYAAIPALRHAPKLFEDWHAKLTAPAYDSRFVPASDKTSATMGMAMTEKQGGSDIRANETRAEHCGGDEYELFGHKWFCSAPMCDAFLTLARTPAGITCFFVPRWRPDGTRNAMHIMRLKNKMGDRSNASSEIEYHGAYARLVGAEGRGVKTIISMVMHTRLDCVVGSAGGMRAALAQAIWHSAHRSAFQKKLIDQPAMAAVLADLAIEVEAATALAFRLASSFDRYDAEPSEAAFARLATPAAKYLVCKRQPAVTYEALECHGGAGFIEESPLPRLYRASPLNAIWEGSGNVIALDTLRALTREPETRDAVIDELDKTSLSNRTLRNHVENLKDRLAGGQLDEGSARAFTEDLALALQGAALAKSENELMLDAFAATRLNENRQSTFFGAFRTKVDTRAIIERASPKPLI